MLALVDLLLPHAEFLLLEYALVDRLKVNIWVLKILLCELSLNDFHVIYSLLFRFDLELDFRLRDPLRRSSVLVPRLRGRSLWTWSESLARGCSWRRWVFNHNVRLLLPVFLVVVQGLVQSEGLPLLALPWCPGSLLLVV